MAEEGGGQGLHVNHVPVEAGDLAARLPVPLLRRPAGRLAETDEGGPSPDPPHLDRRPAVVVAEGEGEAAPHLAYPASGSDVCPGDAGDVEGQVEADEQAPQVPAVVEEHPLDELAGSQQPQTVLRRVGVEQRQLRVADSARGVEETRLPQNVAPPHLVGAETEPLRRIRGGLRVEAAPTTPTAPDPPTPASSPGGGRWRWKSGTAQPRTATSNSSAGGITRPGSIPASPTSRPRASR